MHINKNTKSANIFNVNFDSAQQPLTLPLCAVGGRESNLYQSPSVALVPVVDGKNSEELVNLSTAALRSDRGPNSRIIIEPNDGIATSIVMNIHYYFNLLAKKETSYV